MKINTKQTDVGVIVAKFQLPYLHKTFEDIIGHIWEEHDSILIVICLNPLLSSNENPLDLKTREMMIREQFPYNDYPDIDFAFVKDVQSDDIWSSNLDHIIGDKIGIGQTVTIYADKDRVIDVYTGKHPTQVIEPERIVNIAEMRKKFVNKPVRNRDFRAGVFWKAQNAYPCGFPTVDVAIIDENSDGRRRILLGRKKNETNFRFVGGFFDPEKDKSFEDTARREAFEETGLDVSDVRYIGSSVVDDWRYKDEPNCIVTSLFYAKYTQGRPQADDDLDEVRWYQISELHHSMLVKEHIPLYNMLLEKEFSVA
jgi:bifunctional NMN adenylyltransferase/nudix hydrolase